jgi:hypothetical protein
MVMAPHHLARFAHHRPAALQVQGHPGGVEAHRLQVGAGLLQHQADQGREGRLAVQLPGAVQIAGPGAALLGIAAGLAPQRQDLAQQQGGVEGIGGELHLPQGEGEEGLELEHRRGGGAASSLAHTPSP